MSDRYLSIAQSTLGQQILKAINLPVPTTLNRWSMEKTSFIEGRVLVGTTNNGPLIAALLDTLSNSSAAIIATGHDDQKSLIDKAAHETNCSLHDETRDTEDKKYNGLVFDASGIQCSSELSALYEYFHPVIKKLEVNGRVVILGRPPEMSDTPHMATAQRALEGFTRSLGKETGKRGISVHLLYVEPGAENLIGSSLRFSLSSKSAYISAQTLTITTANALEQTLNWQRPLDNKTALVTGASRGIGLAIAETLARDGARIIGLDIPEAQSTLEAAMKSINGHTLCVNISDSHAANTITDNILKTFGGIDIIVHNAGVTRDKTLGSMPKHFWEQVIDINLTAMERINDALLDKKAINQGGRIVAVSSMSGIAGNFGQSNYAASKAGVIGYVEAMAPLLAKQDITINAVAPGFIETQMTAAIPFTIREVGRRMNAMNQGGLPVDVAEGIALFASSASNGLNGNVLRVCGQSLLGA